MEEYIAKNLLNGEKILWTGRPMNVKTLESPFHVATISRWIGAAILIVFAIWYPSYAPTIGIDPEQIRSISIGSALCGLLLVFLPMLSLNKLKKHCAYYITNKRAMICRQSGTCTMTSRALDDIKTVSYDELSTGCGIVYLGEKTNDSRGMSRIQSTAFELKNAGHLPLMFYSVESPKAVCDLVREAKNQA